jgi:hypothetical protein
MVRRSYGCDIGRVRQFVHWLPTGVADDPSRAL